MKKVAFVDRDGTLIVEPTDNFQVDKLSKLELVPLVIPALRELVAAGYRLVMITNQDGLGTESLPTKDFEPPHQMMLQIFASQGIHFDEVFICPHMPDEGCTCRKPHLGLVREYLIQNEIDFEHSCVVGDRDSDLAFAKNLGVRGFLLQPQNPGSRWPDVVRDILSTARRARVVRKTKETNIEVMVDLDAPDVRQLNTGIGFFDHMLEQISAHGGFGLQVNVEGDLHVDEHHTVEDTALALGEALRRAASDKVGLGRYGFVLPMDETQAQVALDLSGRAYWKFEGTIPGEKVGELSIQMVPHFFRSLADSLKAALHVSVQGENTHHMVESMFKGVGRALRMALTKEQGAALPSTKGTL